MDNTEPQPQAHQSGYVNIIGLPNSGKSTLLNQFMGEKLSIVTHKPQTTRHRLFGILNDDDYQIIFSDTPGLVDQVSYKLHERMNAFVHSSFEDADLLLLVLDGTRSNEELESLIPALSKASCPKFLVINKIDVVAEDSQIQMVQKWITKLPFDEVCPISALDGKGIEQLRTSILKHIPEHPPYFPKDEISDKSLRFFVSEIIREKIFLQFQQEIPYASEVVVHGYQEETDIIRIAADVYVERPTQKSIMIGKKGASIKKLGTEARQDIEKFLSKKVFLELHIRVKANWRKDDHSLQSFGYKN